MAKIIQKLLSQPMDRREFLLRMGAVALTATGVSGILKTMSGVQDKPKSYGAGAYGGSERPARRPVASNDHMRHL